MRLRPSLCYHPLRAANLVSGIICRACYNKANVSAERGESMAELYCPCGQRHKLWGEFWWVGGGYQWIFFDDHKTSATYAEQVECCPACGKALERKSLWA